MLCRLDSQEKHSLPNLRGAQTLCIISDYSGQHETATFETLSFLLTNLENCGLWEQKRCEWRRQFLPDGRRMGFKSLNDGAKQRALEQFLEAADSLVGISISILVRRNIETLFDKNDRTDWSNPELVPYRKWPKRTLEKMLRIVHFASFFTAGFSRSGQDVLWITDEDEIAANESRLRELTRIFGNISSHYLTHDLGHIRCGTTKSDNGSRQLEDLASIPDLVAGAVAESLTVLHRQDLFVGGGAVFPPPNAMQPKVSTLMNWFATNRKPLKRLVAVIEPVSASEALEIKQLKYNGSNDWQD